MESHARTESGQTSDNQQRTTNHIALPSRQVSSLISNDIFNIDDPANGAISLNTTKENILSIAKVFTFEVTPNFWDMEDWRKWCKETAL